MVVVDDDDAMRMFLRETLTSAGYTCRSFPDGGAALGWLSSGREQAHLVLSDIHMPGMSGLDLLRTVKAVVPDLPFILVSGACDLPLARGALRAGATDYMLKPVRPNDLLTIVSKNVKLARPEQFEEIQEALKRSLWSRDESGAYKSQHLADVFDVLGIKRFETLQHSRRVAAFATLIGRQMDFEPAALNALETGALLHDIGKAAIPHNVLMKPGKLTGEEWAIMKMHPQLGVDLLLGLSGVQQESQIVYSHHERFDGTGYPEQLAAAAIPLNARVFSVADTLDALTSDRCYRPGRSLAEARVEIVQASGSHLDPLVVNHFERVPDREIEAVREKFPDS